MRVFAQELGRRGVTVGEVATATARNADFFGDFFAVVNQQDFEAELARLTGTKQAGSARTNHHDIEFMSQIGLLRRQDGRKQL